MPKLLAVDGNSLMHRAFHALPLLTDEQGRYTNAVFGFMGMLIRLLKEETPEYAAVGFDLHGPTFRHEKFDAYKAGRKKTPEELVPQFDLTKEALRAMGVAVLERQGFEADDILGTLARMSREAGMEALLVTGDRDSLQLVGDGVQVLYTKRGISDTDRMDAQAVEQKLGVPPERVPDLKGLMGDSSDNIPGVPGVGEKTATRLLKQFGTLENVLAHADEAGGKKLCESLRVYADQARMSMDLATIDQHIPEGFDWQTLRFSFPKEQEIAPKFTELGFVTLLRRMGMKPMAVQGQAPVAAEEEIVVQACADAQTLLAYVQGKQRVALWMDAHVLQFAVDADHVASLPIQQTLLDTEGVEPRQALLTAAQLLRDPNVEKIVYDAKQWAHMLAEEEAMLCEPCEDCMLLQYVADSAKGQWGLQRQCEAAGLIAPDEAPNAAHLWRLYEKLTVATRKEGTYAVYGDIERPLWRVLFAMERRGFRVDLQQLGQSSQAYGERLQQIETEVVEMAGHPFNLNSTKQLGEVLFDELKLPVIKKTKSGYSTDAAVLEQLSGAHPIVDLMLEYRKLSKLKSTYLDGLQTVADAQGVVHTRFTQNVTATGRISSMEPNLQNIPVRTEMGREIRRAFVPSAPGRVLVAADYSQIELRLLAHMADETHMIDVFLHGGDIHASTAAQVFHVPLCEVTGQMRSAAKAVNFGIIYGISDFGLARNLKISRKEAADTIETYLHNYQKIGAYMQACIDFGKENGYVETLFHRRRYVPELASKNYNQRSFGERVAMNAPIQGTAADLIKAAMICVERELAQRTPQAKLILQVHDELIVDCPASDAEQVKEIVTDCMQNIMQLRVPLLAEAKSGQNWLEAK